MTLWLRYVLAFVVFCHGFIYLRIGPMLMTAVPAWLGRSWVLGQSSVARTLIVPVHVLAGIFTVACAAAIAFAPAFPGWWRPLAVASGAVGIAAFFLFWDGQRQFMLQEGVIGVAVSAALIVAALAV